MTEKDGMRRIELASPAKINLFLAVTGKREDGFHELASLVAPLDFGDTLTIETDGEPGEVALECSDASLPIGEENLAVAAVQRFRERFDIEASVCLRLAKRIPVGAGLGGGSSNAATALQGLARLFEIRNEAALMELAAELGSDCPLFLNNGLCWIRGRGERVTAASNVAREALSGEPLILFKPSFSISTRWAYGELASRAGSYHHADRIEDEIESFEEQGYPLSSLLRNSFEPVACEKFIALDVALRAVRERFGCAAAMSGSGSACFAFCEGAVATEVARYLRESWGDAAFIQACRIA